LQLFAFIFLFNGINMLIIACFTALGKAKIPIIICAARGLAFVLAGVTVLPTFMGITGVWAAIPLAELLTRGVALMLIYRTQKKLA
jgi:Na+-driven multidrug efflux pump